jgi:signal transduction histidine kinase
MRVLLIEDNEDDACLVRETLTERTAPAINLEWVARLGSGLTRLVHDSFDAVLLDLSLPDSQGLNTFDKVHTQSPDVPIVVMTGFDDERTAIQAVQQGAQDYLVKKRLDGDRLVRALRYAIERHRAECRLRQTTEQLRALAGHLETVREEERIRIARELHDELGQKLTGFKMDVSWLGKRLGDSQPIQDTVPLLAKTRAMSALIDETMSGLRRLISELRPAVLDHLGLMAALEWQAEEFHRRTGIVCRFVSPLQDVTLGSAEATTIFRIVQEALTNVVRHAQATEVTIRLHEEAKELRVVVEDNGKGITESAAAGRSSFGIVGLRERVVMLKGRMMLRGNLGHGTTLAVCIPYPKEAA